jgi:transcription elongation factor Elf1
MEGFILKYNCPICGYDKLNKPPYDEQGNESFDICSCCGFEFGYDDLHSGYTFESYRIKWISEGAEWFHKPDLLISLI